MYGANVPFPRDLRHALALAQNYAEEKIAEIVSVETAISTISHEETKTVPFDSILGAKIVDKAPGRLRLITPASRPPEEVDQSLFVAETGFGGVQATYGTNSGLFSNRVMMIVGDVIGNIPVGLASFCYAFATVFKDYNALMYVYETVSDTKGMGVTLNPGWYAVNYSTLAYTEFDIEKYPCHGYSVSSFEPRTGGVSLYFEDAEVIRYTVTEDNVGVYQGEKIVSFAPMREFYEAGCALTKDSNNHHLASMSMLFLAGEELFFENYIYDLHAGTPSLTISYQIAHPLDEKFIPPLDSVTLNSPSGKQFKLTVDDAGTLSATEVT